MVRADVEIAWKTRAGHRHQVEGLENEDAVFVTRDHPMFDALLLVADGMGGHPRPREASEAAVRAARAFLFDPGHLQAGGDVPRILAAAVREAQEAVRALREPGPGGSRSSGTAGRFPGTTLSAAVVADGVLHVAHIGDGSVFLLREGQIRVLAGGEDRRQGNRPAQYLGQDAALETEQRRIPLVEGDRLLLCTDGLTRYFRDAGPEALERVLSRSGVEMQAIASQLTAHSRSDEYDDDTTVAVLCVSAIGQVGARRSGRAGAAGMAEGGRAVTPVAVAERGNASSMPPLGQAAPAARRGAASTVILSVAGAVVGAGLLAAGFLAGRALPPPSGAPGATVPEPQPERFASGEELRRLPSGNLVLVDSLGKRVFSLGTQPRSRPTGTVELNALRLDAAGHMVPAGKFRLDTAAGTLRDADGRQYPVEVDLDGGTIRVLRSGSLTVNSESTDALVFVDGRRYGAPPVQLRLPAGRHHVRVQGKDWSAESDVELPAGRSVSLTLGTP